MRSTTVPINDKNLSIFQLSLFGKNISIPCSSSTEPVSEAFSQLHAEEIDSYITTISKSSREAKLFPENMRKPLTAHLYDYTKDVENTKAALQFTHDNIVLIADVLHKTFGITLDAAKTKVFELFHNVNYNAKEFLETLDKIATLPQKNYAVFTNAIDQNNLSTALAMTEKLDQSEISIQTLAQRIIFIENLLAQKQQHPTHEVPTPVSMHQPNSNPISVEALQKELDAIKKILMTRAHDYSYNVFGYSEAEAQRRKAFIVGVFFIPQLLADTLQVIAQTGAQILYGTLCCLWEAKICSNNSEGACSYNTNVGHRFGLTSPATCPSLFAEKHQYCLDNGCGTVIKDAVKSACGNC